MKCPDVLRWIGRIELTAIPNNELRVLNIFLKIGNSDPNRTQIGRSKPKKKNEVPWMNLLNC
jgi:hypothetical protein